MKKKLFLGKGAFGKVYKCVELDTECNREFVAKCLEIVKEVSNSKCVQYICNSLLFYFIFLVF